MDEDIYDVLMGELPKTSEMSKALRRQQKLGQLGMATGDRVVAPTGEKLYTDAGNQAWREAQTDMNKRNVLSRALEAQQQREFMAEQNRLARQNALQIAGMRMDDAGTKYVRRELQSLGRDYVKSGIPDLDSAMGSLEDILKPYEGKDIPGMGATGFLPSALVSQDAKKVRQAVAAVSNRLLKVRSGSAVTDQEFQRFGQELGTYLGATDAELMRAIPLIRQTMTAAQNSIFAGYDPEIVDVYKGRLGGGSSGMQTQEEEEGQTDLSGLSQEELEAIAYGNQP